MPIFKFWRTTTVLAANEPIANGGRTYKANAASAAQTHTIAAPGKDGRELYVVKTDTSANTVTLTLNLDGVAGASIVLANKGDAVKLYDDGTTWTTLGNRPSAASLAATYVTRGDIAHNVLDYGVKLDGSDQTTAFSAMLATIMALNPSGSGNPGTNYTPRIYIPAGNLVVAGDITTNLAVTSAFTSRRRRLTIEGDAEGGTMLTLSSANGWAIKGGYLTVRNLRIYGAGTNTVFQLGDTSGASGSYVNQFQFENLQFFNYGIAINALWLFDGTFRDVGMLGTAQGGAAFNFPLHSTDCGNNILWQRVHMESYTTSVVPGGLTTAFVRAVGGNTSARQHGRFTFNGCHWETRRLDISALDLTYCNDISIVGGSQLLQWDALGDTSFANAVPLVRLVNTSGVSITGSPLIARNATASSTPYAHALFSLGGYVRGLTLTGAWLLPNSGVSNESSAALWESDATTAYISDGGPGVYLGPGCRIADRTLAPLGASVLPIGSATTRSNRWALQYNDNLSGDLSFHWTGDGTFLGSAQPMVRMSKDGAFKSKYGFTGYDTSTVANGATKTVDLLVGGNANKEGIWLVYSNTTGATGYALIMSMGVAGVWTPILVGGAFSVAPASSSTTNPNTANKANLYLSSTGALMINNQLGYTVRFSAIPFGIHFGS